MKLTKPKDWVLGMTALTAMAGVGMTAVSCTAHPTERVVRITAKRFEYQPASVTLKKGQPAVIELTSLDRLHGFTQPELGIRADVLLGETARVHFVPRQSGLFPFHCDIFCGTGHEGMTGTIRVVD
jgi:cytochrome c oxidase subunit 2